MVKHVRSSNLKRVVRVEVIDCIDRRTRKPDLLEKDNARFGGAEKVRQILTVSPETLQVE